MMQHNAGEPFKGRCGDVIVVLYPQDGRVWVEAREYRILYCSAHFEPSFCDKRVISGGNAPLAVALLYHLPAVIANRIYEAVYFRKDCLFLKVAQ